MERKYPKLILINPDYVALAIIALFIGFISCIAGGIMVFSLHDAAYVVGGDSFNYVLHRQIGTALILEGIFLALFSSTLVFFAIYNRLSEFFNYTAQIDEYDHPEATELKEESDPVK